jgi:phospholipid-translocating ATPase
MTLVFRNDKEIKIRNANDVIEEYDVLANFPFSSDTKRMGILLRNKKHRHIIFYLKGAESIMEQFAKQEYKGYIRENAENLACLGLRTLVLTQKIISEEFYKKWQHEYSEARTSLDNRNEKILEAMGKLEQNMDFLAVTGVEDLLQDDVCNTIESLRNAGIKIWMLTGDKVETATCISISAGLKNKSDKLFYIKERAKEKDYVVNELKKIEFNISQTVLIIDGDCLEVALNQHEREFFEIAMKVNKS